MLHALRYAIVGLAIVTCVGAVNTGQTGLAIVAGLVAVGVTVLDLHAAERAETRARARIREDERIRARVRDAEFNRQLRDLDR